MPNDKMKAYVQAAAYGSAATRDSVKVAKVKPGGKKKPAKVKYSKYGKIKTF